MSAVDGQTDENQPMSLKVMRLTAPSLNLRPENFLEFSEREPEAIELKAFPKNTDPRYGTCELNPSLSVPSPLDTIYLGETFSSYICVNNETDDLLQHMTLKVELQATNRHFSLIDTTISPQNIKPRNSSQFIVHHEVKELGMHFLLCSVHYLTAAQERKFFKKIYKVNVLNPLAVKTKSNNLRVGGVVLLEVQIQNLSNLNMFLESLQFDPVEAFSFKDLNFVFSDLPFGKVGRKPKSEETSFPEPRAENPDDHPDPGPKGSGAEDTGLEAEFSEKDGRSSPVSSSEESGQLENPENGSREIEPESLHNENEIPTSPSSPSKPSTPPNEAASTPRENRPEPLAPETPVSPAKGQVLQKDIEASRVTVFGAINCIKPMETRQYLYKLNPRDDLSNEAYISSELGKLDIVWRSSFCSIGRLQTSQLTRRPPLLEMVEIRVVSIPELILAEVPFPVMCRVQNRTKEEMHLKLAADRTKIGSLLFSGISPLDLGPIGPGHAFTFELEFLPLTPGPHKLGGLKITDLLSKISHDIETLAEVFVQRHE